MSYIRISEKVWSKFKQELIPILFLSGIQIWWSFNFPIIVRSGDYWNSVLALSSSILGVAAIVFVFSTANDYVPYAKLDHVDDINVGGASFKKVSRIMIVSIFLIGMFILWYTDFYGMSHLHYLFHVSYSFLMLGLLYRAIFRGPPRRHCYDIE